MYRVRGFGQRELRMMTFSVMFSTVRSFIGGTWSAVTGSHRDIVK